MQNSENKEVINITLQLKKDHLQEINRNYVLFVKCLVILQKIVNLD